MLDLDIKNTLHTYLFLSVFILASRFCVAQSNANDSCAFFGGKPIYPYYYYAQPSCKVDFYQLKKQFKEACKNIKAMDGIYTISFYINYKGESDFFKSTVIDLNYQKKEITQTTTQLVEALTSVIKRAGTWMPSKDEKGNAMNARKFYSFKFINNQLVEILPK